MYYKALFIVAARVPLCEYFEFTWFRQLIFHDLQENGAIKMKMTEIEYNVHRVLLILQYKGFKLVVLLLRK